MSGYFLPHESRLVHVFIGAALCATSVGITARVLKDLGKLSLRESRIILGAAVIDDVIGLVILAVIVGVVKAAATGTSLSLADLGWIAAKTAAFFVSAFAIGSFAMPPIFRGAARFMSRGVLLVLSIAFCFWLSWMATRVGLAAIVGAFAAGLVLEDAHFKSFIDRGEHDVRQLLAPVTTVLVPIFFVLMGLKVDLRVFARPALLGFALALTLAAIIGKQICSLAVAERGLNRLAIGLGMIPRGEVGLIVAGIGVGLTMPNAAEERTGRWPGNLRRRRDHGDHHDAGHAAGAEVVAGPAKVFAAHGRTERFRGDRLMRLLNVPRNEIDMGNATAQERPAALARRLSVKLRGWRVVLRSASLTVLLSSGGSRAAQKAALPQQLSTVVCVVSGDEPSEMGMDAVVIIEKGKFLAPFKEYDDPDQQRFADAYFRPGQKYRLTFGGGDAGTRNREQVRQRLQQHSCTVTVETSAKIHGQVMGLATNSETLGRKPSSRRAPTDGERAAVMTLW